MIKLSLVLLVFATISVKAQDSLFTKHLQSGITFDLSNDEFNNVTGIGIFIEGSYFRNEKFRVSAKIEPTALAYGILVLPGGCTQEHPRYPGMPSCREGANFLTKASISGDYMLGHPKIGSKIGRHQFYAGLQFVMLTHQRYVITSRIPGNYRDTRRWITDIGGGFQLGRLMGRFDFSISYNFVGDAFQDFAGFNLGYVIWRR